MNEFVDITGASGTSYRFRLAADAAALPDAAGNFVFVRQEDGRAHIVGSGSAGNLAVAAKLWARAVAEQQADSLYFYLSIARRMRTEVHEDIAEKHHPALIAVES